MRRWAAAFLCALAQATAQTAAPPAIAQQLLEITLDPETCYRVRDLRFAKADARLYFTDGYLIFARPVGDTPVAAVFTGGAAEGDGEILLLPPSRAERQSLATHTGSPNLSERFSNAVLIFSDESARELQSLIEESPANRKDGERGAAIAAQWNPVVRNIATSFESRLLLDLYTRQPQQLGFFTAALSGKILGNVDLWHDPRAREQMLVGQIGSREGRASFEVWTSFETRGARAAHAPETALSNYRIHAVVEPDLTLKVTTRVTVTPGPAARNVAPFEMSGRMRMLSASIDGEPATVVQRDSVRPNLIRNSLAELILVIPPRPLVPGRPYEFELQAEGKVILDAGNNVYYVGARASWYPSRGMQFATHDLTFQYPKRLRLVTPGEVVEEKTEGEWRITRRRTPPIRIAGFNLGDYEHTRVSRAGCDIDVYANRSLEQALQPRPQPLVLLPPANTPWNRPRRGQPQVLALPEVPTPKPASRLQELAGEVAAALEFMTSRFGPPATRILNVSPVPGRFGQGFPGLIYLSTLSYLGPDSKPLASLNERQVAFFSDILHAHEVAHQWWGNLVTSEGYRDDWLMEGLANYSALLYLEKRKGPKSLEAALDEHRAQLLERTPDGNTVESSGPIVLGARLTSAAHPDAWRRITYGKGSWIMHMLRRRLADDGFFSMLAALRQRFEGKRVTTEQFRLLAAGFLPPKSPDPKLEAFFEQWVYGAGIPKFDFKHSTKGKAPNVRLTGAISQHEVDQDYLAEVPIEIHFRRGKPQVLWLPASSESSPFTIPLKEAPLRVVFNPGQAVLLRD